MWLIHTTGLMLREFHGDIIPPYAILSHCWDENPSNEVSFSDFRKNRNAGSLGMIKIANFCATAAKEHNLKWAWVDTCCIDKKSSADLSEAINSMHRYYARAKVCLVFLNDVDVSGVDEDGEECPWPTSKWFSRGWTLQELLAPAAVHFYDLEWRRIGTRDDFADDISTLTGISIHHIRGDGEDPFPATAGRRLSWAATRRTTRPEDRAYSLLGLLDVHMPLLYGERERAFIRLQQDILESTADESILSWDCEDSSLFASIALGSFHGNIWLADSVLAEAPDRFLHNPDIELIREDNSVASRRMRPPSVTSWGIELASSAKELWPNAEFFDAINRVHGPSSESKSAAPLLLIPLVVSDGDQSHVLSCVLVLAPLTVTGRYGRMCCVKETFSSLKEATFYKPYFDLVDEAKEVTLYLKT